MTTIHHGTSQEFNTLELGYDACLDCGTSIPAPALFWTTDKGVAEYFATGQEIEQGPRPRIIHAAIESTAITTVDARNDDELDAWMEEHYDEIQDGDFAAITSQGLDHAAIILFDLGAITITGESAA